MHRPNPASAENGRRSRGPITEEGKEKARLAVLKHGLCSKIIALLPGERPTTFLEDFQLYVDKFQPADDVEFHHVINLNANNWRLGRAMGMEKALLTMNMQDTAYTENGADRLLSVLDTARFNTLQVYISRIERSYQRALNNLLKIQRHFAELEEMPKVEEMPELAFSPAPPPPLAVEIPPEPATAEPVAPPETQEKPVQPPPPAPQAPKHPQKRQKTVEQNPIEPVISPDDWPKAA